MLDDCSCNRYMPTLPLLDQLFRIARDSSSCADVGDGKGGLQIQNSCMFDFLKSVIGIGKPAGLPATAADDATVREIVVDLKRHFTPEKPLSSSH
jgi:hypothetical protein